jgi:hypothetical protein
VPCHQHNKVTNSRASVSWLLPLELLVGRWCIFYVYTVDKMDTKGRGLCNNSWSVVVFLFWFFFLLIHFFKVYLSLDLS